MPFLILFILLSIVVALFAIQNAVAVSLNFAVWTFYVLLGAGYFRLFPHGSFSSDLLYVGDEGTSLFCRIGR